MPLKHEELWHTVMLELVDAGNFKSDDPHAEGGSQSY